jgi:hypothetical protein
MSSFYLHVLFSHIESAAGDSRPHELCSIMTQAVAMKFGGLTTHNRSHRRLAAFVDWIKPEPETRDAIREQAADIRRIISGQATTDGLSIVATPEAGSFAKHTGLRRHMRGNSEIEG